MEAARNCCFHSAVDAEAARAGTVAMHDGVAGYFVRDDGGTSYDLAKGSSDPAWTWYSFFGGHSFSEVYARGGGPFAAEVVGEAAVDSSALLGI